MAWHFPRAGDVVGGKYRLIRLLGSGGMGAVYEAENAFTKKRVALKWLRPTLMASDSGPDTRLLREAQAAARVKHRNVVDVYDIGFEQHAMFMVMELLEGESLGTFLESSAVHVHEFLALILPAMRGVAEAHRQGVVHRDLKPENIFFAREIDQALPTTKVVDFGIAKVDDAHSLTRTGHAVGTPLFMALEQLQGKKDIDGRVDVYGFGVILYIALTGMPPHSGASLPEIVLNAATKQAVPPHMLRPELPRALSNIVMRAIASDRTERTQTLTQLIAELTPFASEHGYRQSSDKLAYTIRVPARDRAQPEPLLWSGVQAMAGITTRGASAGQPPLPHAPAGTANDPASPWRKWAGATVAVLATALLGALGTVALRAAPSAHSGSSAGPVSPAAAAGTRVPARLPRAPDPPPGDKPHADPQPIEPHPSQTLQASPELPREPAPPPRPDVAPRDAPRLAASLAQSPLRAGANADAGAANLRRPLRARTALAAPRAAPLAPPPKRAGEEQANKRAFGLEVEDFME